MQASQRLSRRDRSSDQSLRLLHLLFRSNTLINQVKCFSRNGHGRHWIDASKSDRLEASRSSTLCGNLWLETCSLSFRKLRCGFPLYLDETAMHSQSQIQATPDTRCLQMLHLLVQVSVFSGTDSASCLNLPLLIRSLKLPLLMIRFLLQIFAP